MSTENDLNIAEIHYDSGAIKFRYSRVLSLDGTRWVLHGFFLAYHVNGNVASEGHFTDGKEDGLWRDFHSNGVLASEGRYCLGRQVGVWRFWMSDGVEDPVIDYGD